MNQKLKINIKKLHFDVKSGVFEPFNCSVLTQGHEAVNHVVE